MYKTIWIPSSFLLIKVENNKLKSIKVTKWWRIKVQSWRMKVEWWKMKNLRCWGVLIYDRWIDGQTFVNVAFAMLLKNKFDEMIEYLFWKQPKNSFIIFQFNSKCNGSGSREMATWRSLMLHLSLQLLLIHSL